MQHILLSCVFARELWFQVLSKVGLQNLSPGLEVAVFQEWWRQSETQLSNEQRKGFNSLVFWWLGGFGNTGMNVSVMKPLQACLESYKTQVKMSGCGV